MAGGQAEETNGHPTLRTTLMPTQTPTHRVTPGVVAVAGGRGGIHETVVLHHHKRRAPAVHRRQVGHGEVPLRRPGCHVQLGVEPQQVHLACRRAGVGRVVADAERAPRECRVRQTAKQPVRVCRMHPAALRPSGSGRTVVDGVPVGGVGGARHLEQILHGDAAAAGQERRGGRGTLAASTRQASGVHGCAWGAGDAASGPPLTRTQSRSWSS